MESVDIVFHFLLKGKQGHMWKDQGAEVIGEGLEFP